MKKTTKAVLGAALAISAVLGGSASAAVADSAYPGTFLGDDAGRYVATQSTSKVKVSIQTGCAAWNDSAYIGVHLTAIQHSNRPYTVTLEGTHKGYNKESARTVELSKQVGSTAYVGINSGRTLRPEGTITVTIEKADAEPQVLTFDRPKVNCNKGGAFDVVVDPS